MSRSQLRARHQVLHLIAEPTDAEIAELRALDEQLAGTSPHSAAAAKLEYCDDGNTVERFPVTGGWLYRTCSWVALPSPPCEPTQGYYAWSAPVFFADMNGAKP